MKRKFAVILPLALLYGSGCAHRIVDDQSTSERNFVPGYAQEAAPLAQSSRLSAAEAATRRDVIGCVVVEYMVDKNGVPGDAMILESRPAGYFDAKALKAMEFMRFKPRKKVSFGRRTFSFTPDPQRYPAAVAAAMCAPGRPDEGPIELPPAPAQAPEPPVLQAADISEPRTIEVPAGAVGPVPVPLAEPAAAETPPLAEYKTEDTKKPKTVRRPR